MYQHIRNEEGLWIHCGKGENAGNQLFFTFSHGLPTLSETEDIC